MSLDELLLAARAGDPKASKALATTLHSRLTTYFRRRSPESEVEDRVHTSLVLIYRRIGSFEVTHPRSLERFVFSVAHGVLLTSRRSWAREQGRRIDSVPSSLIAAETSVSERVARREHLAQILAAMSDLDTLDHTTIVGWLEASSGRELAMREGVAWATLRTRVHRALARLRDNLRRRSEVAFMPEPSTT